MTAIPKDDDILEIERLIAWANKEVMAKGEAKFWTLYRLCHWYLHNFDQTDLSLDQYLRWADRHRLFCHFNQDGELRIK